MGAPTCPDCGGGFIAGIHKCLKTNNIIELKQGAPEVSSNPKDLVGDTKLPLHLFPPSAIAYGCLGMLEGKLKYGLANYRGSKVIASIYVAAVKRHIDEWYEGMDTTEEGGPTLGNALACLAISLFGIILSQNCAVNSRAFCFLVI